MHFLYKAIGKYGLQYMDLLFNCRDSRGEVTRLGRLKSMALAFYLITSHTLFAAHIANCGQ